MSLVKSSEQLSCNLTQLVAEKVLWSEFNDSFEKLAVKQKYLFIVGFIRITSKCDIVKLAV